MLNLSFLGINHPLIRIYNNKDQDLWQNIIELIIKKIQLTCDIIIIIKIKTMKVKFLII